jgi:type IV pilus assembly protein PilB
MKALGDEELKKILLEGSFLDESKVLEAVTIAKQTNKDLEHVILEKEWLTDAHMGQIIANEMKVPFVDLGTQALSEEMLGLFPEAFAIENNVIAFSRDEAGLHVALHEPNNAHLTQLIEKKIDEKVNFHYTTLNNLSQAFHKFRKNLDQQITKLSETALSKSENSKNSDQDTEVIEIVEMLLEYAYTSKASDLHFEPQDSDTVVRFRVDGVLKDMIFLPKALHDRIVTRFKILSHLRTDEHFAALDGHMNYKFVDEKVDIRISILPTTFGEKIVLRLLSEKSRQFSLEELGFGGEDLVNLKKQANKPWGMILVTGPTGSGKTTSLYAVMKILNQRDVNISTIEDPVEYSIAGVNQIQVNKKTELGFSQGLRSIVRQDPDIIMVGEIRDPETADIAINAALTGHLLLSTLHTNDAATALPRLIEMDVEPFLVASTVNVVLAQRLVRKICLKCIGSYEATVEELEEEGLVVPDKVKETIFKKGGKARLYKGSGCPVCHDTGYSGRTGVFEVLVVDAEIKKMILDHQSSDVIRDYAVSQGMTTMFDDAVAKVLQGGTTLEEVLRVVRD